MSKTIKRPGAGRTKGSFSFVKITVEALVKKFADQSTVILVSRKQAEALGFTGLTTGAVGALQESVTGQSEESKVAVQVTEL